MKLSNYTKERIFVVIFCIAILCTPLLPYINACTISHPHSSSSNETLPSTDNSTSTSRNDYESPPQRLKEDVLDPYWPTTNPNLLAIPEEHRWYNAANHAGTNCTISGPVVNVYQAVNETGAPIFVSIGAQYPDPQSVTLVIWSEYLPNFEDMLHSVDHGGGWLEVTGYLSVYNGNLQFNSNSPLSFRWWNPS